MDYVLELVNHFTSRATARYRSLLCMMDETPSAEHRSSHCSYLDIYISRKIRLCVVDMEGKFQTPQLFGLEIQIYHFSSILCRRSQIESFLHTVAAILRCVVPQCESSRLWGIFILVSSRIGLALLNRHTYKYTA